ncbi:MAG: ABC transporter substrate-binding protein [bacterium]|nr:ABC transporter substrate-binding protein [bacterium]
MKTRWRFLAVVALMLLLASACSDDDPAPIASTPDVTAALETDAVESDPGETARESEQPAPTEEADESEPDASVQDDAGQEPPPESSEAEATEPETPEAADAEEADQGVVQPEEESALEQLRRRMAAAAAFGGLVPSMAIVEELRRNAEGFSYEIGVHGGTITVATISEPLTFNLALARDAGSSGVLGYLFEGLTQTSWLNDEIEPLLAQSWERSDDGLHWVFHLRDDVQWHDGTPFTAHDVEFTFNRVIYNDDFQAASRASFEFRFLNDETGQWEQSQMTVTALDDLTVEFVLPQPFAPFLRSLGTAIYPKHILEEPIEAGTFEEFWGIDTDPIEIIGTGPFTIGEYTPGERFVFERNPDYWLVDDAGEHLPYLDQVVQLIVEDLEDELTLFRDGTTDFHGVLGEEFALLDPVADAENFTLHRRGPGFGTNFLAFNQNPGINDAGESYVDPIQLHWFQNVAFRQAVAHTMDKATMIDRVQHGLGYPQWSSVSPAAGDFHNPEVRQYAYDVDRANEILDEMGWLDTDGDGIREDDMGNPISFTLVTNEGNSVRAEITGIIHEGMTAIGLDVDFQIVEFGSMVAQLTATYDWEAMVIGLTGSPDPFGGMTVWHSGEGLHLWHPNQPEPATEWEADIDELYIAGSKELDHEQRVQHYWDAQAIVAENVPLIYTTQSERLGAVRNVFGNYTPTLYGYWDLRYLFRADQ